LVGLQLSYIVNVNDQ